MYAMYFCFGLFFLSISSATSVVSDTYEDAAQSLIRSEKKAKSQESIVIDMRGPSSSSFAALTREHRSFGQSSSSLHEDLDTLEAEEKSISQKHQHNEEDESRLSDPDDDRDPAGDPGDRGNPTYSSNPAGPPRRRRARRRAIPCQWTNWQGWSGCTASCGGGDQQRFRYIHMEAQHGGDECEGPKEVTQSCGDEECPTTTVRTAETTTTAGAVAGAQATAAPAEEKKGWPLWMKIAIVVVILAILGAGAAVAMGSNQPKKKPGLQDFDGEGVVMADDDYGDGGAEDWQDDDQY